jgi:hypothetical protein
MLNSRILPLSVFTYQYRVHIIIRSFESPDGNAWTDIRKKVEGSSQSQVQRHMTLANYIPHSACQYNRWIKYAIQTGSRQGAYGNGSALHVWLTLIY